MVWTGPDLVKLDSDNSCSDLYPSEGSLHPNTSSAVNATSVSEWLASVRFTLIYCWKVTVGMPVICACVCEFIVASPNPLSVFMATVFQQEPHVPTNESGGGNILNPRTIYLQSCTAIKPDFFNIFTINI